MGQVICGTSYCGPKSRGRSAMRLVRYIEMRREERDERDEREGRELYHRVPTFGDREQFLEAAKERAEAGRRSSYVHVVLSPERGQEFRDSDLKDLARPWTLDRNGREASWFGVIHRDTDHPHMHVAVARDKFGKEELERLKEKTHERVQERERFAERRQEREREREQERGPGRERGESRKEHERLSERSEQEHEQGSARDARERVGSELEFDR